MALKIKPKIRSLKELKQVVYDKNWLRKTKDFPVYYMYRGVKKKGNLRYDITVIPSKMLNGEFAKTQGHHHPANYGEVYTVLKGKALFLMQKVEKNKVRDVFAIKAKKGENIIVPPGYGHVTINPSGETLKLANWASNSSKSIYGLLGKKGGACYYYTKTGWVKNKNYGKVPPLRFKKPLKALPKDLSFLEREGGW